MNKKVPLARRNAGLPKVMIFCMVVVTLAGGAYGLTRKRSMHDSVSTGQATTRSSSPSLTPMPTKLTYSIDEPGSLWWVVNKKRPLPDSYEPSDLSVPNVPLRLNQSAEQMHIRSIAKTAVEQLFEGAKNNGLSLQFASGFRSYEYQKQLYGSYVAKDGVAAADLYSARPGHSEHQTGLAFDVQLANGTCTLEICFGDTDAGKWLAENAHTYGFIIRYPNNKTSVTGYQYEPWHLRYVGKDLASDIHSQNTTLEEYFGLAPAPTY